MQSAMAAQVRLVDKVSLGESPDDLLLPYQWRYCAFVDQFSHASDMVPGTVKGLWIGIIKATRLIFRLWCH